LDYFERLLHLDRVRGIVVNIVGPPDSGKSSLTYNYAAHVVNRRQPVVFVTLDRPPEYIISRIRGLTDIDRSTFDSLTTIVDGYSPTVGLDTNQKLSFNARNLSDFNISLSISLKKRPDAVFIDPFSVFFFLHDETPLIRAIQVAMAKLRVGANHSFITYEEGVHSQIFYNTIRFLGDINLTLRREETVDGKVVRSLQVHSSKVIFIDPKLHSFTIDLLGRVGWRSVEKIGSGLL